MGLFEIIFDGVIIFIVLGFLRNFWVQRDLRQGLFLKGKVPKPDGFFRGSVEKLKTNWIGKTFDASRSKGINIFSKSGKEIKKYPFKTYVGKGLKDKELDVLKIDYDLNENPFWVRRILDELVEVEREKYLGKLHVRILPGISFVLGYFRLEE